MGVLRMSELSQALQKDLRQIVTEIAEMTNKERKSEAFQQWLKVASMFHSYSWNNTLLIFSQKPDATRVASFTTWKNLGRFVKRGQHAIHILRPQWRKEIDPKTGDEVERIYFVGACVFDVSQTDGQPLPDLEDITRDPGERMAWAHAKMLQLYKEKGIQLAFENLPNGIKGVSRKGSVSIESRMTVDEQFGVLIHEYAHEMLHHRPDCGDRFHREHQAEICAGVISAAYGLDVSYTAAYLASWQASADDIMEAFEIARETALDVLRYLEMVPAKKDETESDVA